MRFCVFRPAMAGTVFAFVLLSTPPVLAQLYGGSSRTTGAATSPAPQRSKGKNTLRVKCVDQAGNPLKGIKVEAENRITEKKKNKKCNAAGVALFEKLDSGVYELVARQKGFEPSLYDFVLLEGGSQESVTLVFKPGDKDKPLYFEEEGAALRQQAQQQLNQGFQLLEAGKFAEGEELLKASIANDPSDPRAYYYLGSGHLRQDQWDEAKKSLERAVLISTAQIQITASDFEGQSNPYETFYQQSSKLLDDLAPSRLSSEANAALEAKNLEVAIAKLQELVTLRPDNADSLYTLAVAQGNAELYQEAIQSVDNALQLKPDDKSYADLREGLAERQQRAEVMRALAAGDEHFNQGDFAAALKEYQAGLPLVPESSKPLMWIQIAKTHAQLNQLDEAVQAYRQAIQMAPDNSEYPEALVSHYLAQEQSREAIEVYADLFAKRSEPVAEGLFAKGQEFSRKAKPEMAQAAYEKALEVDPEYAEAVYELGMVYFYDVKDNARSREMLTRYLAMGKDAAHVSNAESVLAVMK